MSRRQLRFHGFEDVLVDVRRLQASGCRPLRSWNLPQTCEHLRLSFEASIRGFGFESSWYVRIFLARFFLRRTLRLRVIPERVRTGPAMVPAADSVADTAIAHLARAIDEFCMHPGPFAPHPIFGRMTRQEWEVFHLIHCEHHLSFLAK